MAGVKGFEESRDDTTAPREDYSNASVTSCQYCSASETSSPTPPFTGLKPVMLLSCPLSITVPLLPMMVLEAAAISSKKSELKASNPLILLPCATLSIRDRPNVFPPILIAFQPSPMILLRSTTSWDVATRMPPVVLNRSVVAAASACTTTV